MRVLNKADVPLGVCDQKRLSTTVVENLLYKQFSLKKNLTTINVCEIYM